MGHRSHRSPHRASSATSPCRNPASQPKCTVALYRRRCFIGSQLLPVRWWKWWPFAFCSLFLFSVPCGECFTAGVLSKSSVAQERVPRMGKDGLWLIYIYLISISGRGHTSWGVTPHTSSRVDQMIGCFPFIVIYVHFISRSVGSFIVKFLSKRNMVGLPLGLTAQRSMDLMWF